MKTTEFWAHSLMTVRIYFFVGEEDKNAFALKTFMWRRVRLIILIFCHARVNVKLITIIGVHVAQGIAIVFNGCWSK